MKSSTFAIIAMIVLSVLGLGVSPPFVPLLAAAAETSGVQGSAVERAEYGGYHFYFGNLHAHTGYSDGLKLPEDAFRQARDMAGMDFMAVTDHDYMMLEVPEHWEELKKTALRWSEDGRFVALSGAEWTENTSGHINLFSDGPMITRDDYPNPAALYRWLDGAPIAVAQFNHPNPEFQKNWDDFAYDWNANKVIRLLEVGNGFWTNNLRYESSYVRALDKGWYVSATSNQDNHSDNWGTEGDSRTGILAPALTRENVIAALRANRTYAAEDRNVAVYFAAEGEGQKKVILGGHLDHNGYPIRLSWHIADPDPGDEVARVEVITNGGQVVGSFDTGETRPDAAAGQTGPTGPAAPVLEGQLDVTPTTGYSWYYLRVTQKDGDRVVTAPIWVEHPSRLALVDLTVAGPMAKVGSPAVIGATLVNHSDRVLSDVEVLFWTEGSNVPFSRLTLDVPAGGVIPVRADWVPEKSGSQGVVAAIGGITADERATASGSAAGNDLAAGGGQVPNRYHVFAEVRPSDLPRVLIDEGHNNRFTGLTSRFQSLLSRYGWESAINEGTITAAGLSGYQAVIIATPEEGISLLPNTFSDEEIAALVDYVSGGGMLVLAGAGAELAREGADLGELNRLLEALGSSMRFDDKGTVSVASSKNMVFAVSGPVGDTASGQEVASDWTSAPALHVGEAAFAAYEKVGAGGGLVVALGEPVYSDYHLPGDGAETGNAAFLRSLLAWLAGR